MSTKSNQSPLELFEGNITISAILSTGGAFAATEHGQAYVPVNTAIAYGMKRGDTMTAVLRPNDPERAAFCPFMVVGISSVTPRSTNPGAAPVVPLPTTRADTQTPTIDTLTLTDLQSAIIAALEDIGAGTNDDLVRYIEDLPEDTEVRTNTDSFRRVRERTLHMSRSDLLAHAKIFDKRGDLHSVLYALEAEDI